MLFNKQKKLCLALTGGFAVASTILAAGSFFGNAYAPMINHELGIQTTKIEQGTSTGDSQYFKSAYSTEAELQAKEESLCIQLQKEGSVLVKNANKTLPLSSSAKVSLFSRSSVDIVYGGTGSGQVDTATAPTLKTALEKDGVTVNPTLWNFYTGVDSKTYTRKHAGMWTDYAAVGATTSLGEVPVSELTSEVKSSYAAYQDAAIVVISRIGGEGYDVPSGEFIDGKNVLALQDVEKDLLKHVKENFTKIVVLINSSNAMELSFLDQSEYGINACLWIGGPGQVGLYGVADILTGKANPSGKFADTYSSSTLSSAAMQNFGSYTYTNADPKTGTVGGVAIDGAPGDLTAGRYSTHYLVEKEGIYVGYKYYETRYEDAILKQGNATGSAGVYNSTGSSWNYTQEVDYPFGYGLSYTSFTQSLDSITYDNSKDVYTVKATVKNTGTVAGKDVVQVYAQSPYTDFDKTNGIEKAAVQLAGFAKSSELAAGASEQLSITVDRRDLATYDQHVNKTYIMEDGNYYLAIGSDSHDALNNILAAKGATGMVDTAGESTAGAAAKAKKFTQAKGAVDATTYAYSKTNKGVKITNQFDNTDLNSYGDYGVTYLTRNNWQTTFPTPYATLTANDKVIAALQFNYEAGSSDISSITLNAGNGYQAISMRGLTYDDANWDLVLNNLTIDDMALLIGRSGYATQAATSVGLPGTKSADGPQGLKGSYSSGVASMAYTTEPVMASTFNVDLIEELGECVGEDGLKIGVQGWYGPAMNTHRTPYVGRNFEYFSEDGFLAGKMAAVEVEGAQSKGLISYVKHFALNDQETFRQSYAWLGTEQAIREIFLKPFQMAIEDGGAKAVMTSFNRVGFRWAGAHKGLCTNVLHNEWGFNGFTLTDAVMTNRNWMDYRIGLEAGNDSWLSSGDWLLSKITASGSTDVKLLGYMRTSCHRILYTLVNSAAMNGIDSSTKVVTITAGWQIALNAVSVSFYVLTGLALLAVAIIYINPKKSVGSKESEAK